MTTENHPTHWWSFVREALYFYVNHDGKRVQCCLPSKVALTECVEAADREKLVSDYFRRNRTRIEIAAKAAINQASSLEPVVVLVEV